MQRLLNLKLASNLPKNLSNSTATYKTVTSLAKPAETHLQNRLSKPSLSHPFHRYHLWRSQHILSGKIHGLPSNSILSKKFLMDYLDTLLRISNKSLFDARVRFLKVIFPKRSSQFSPSFDKRRWRSWFQGLTADNVVFGLIIANVAVFFLWRIADHKFMMNNFTVSVENFKSGRLHTMITSAFSHIEVEHLVSNMIGLYFFGMNIGRFFGPEFLLKLYLAGAVGGSVFYLVHHAYMGLSSKDGQMWQKDPSKSPGLGASGAVNAIMLLDIFLFPKSTLYFEFIIPVPAILLGIFLIGKDMLRIIEGDSHISGAAHLGGAAVAAIAWTRIKKGRF